VKVAHGLDKKDAISVTLDIAPQSIAVSVLRGGQAVTLDNWAVTMVHGKFGFHIPGSDEIGLQDFHLGGN
jgi:hypothetical protein